MLPKPSCSGMRRGEASVTEFNGPAQCFSGRPDWHTSLDISQGYVKLVLPLVKLIHPGQSLDGPSPCSNQQHHTGVQL